jgi:hypothetical protein
MYWKANVLVIANRTLDSPELREALVARCNRTPATFTILVPSAPAGRPVALASLNATLERLREAGLEVDGVLGDADPMIAIEESWNPAEFDEVIVSTLPTNASKWLLIDLPHRVARTTGASVTHVVARAPELALR